MANAWFRFYSSAVNDPKVQRLPPALFKTWVNILCVASDNDGFLPPISDLAFLLRVDEEALGEDFDALVAAGLIDETDTHATPHNWKTRQFQSDNSTARVQRFRNGNKDKARNVSETANVTPPDTDSEQKQTLPSEASAPTTDDAKVALEIYNAACPETGWPVAQRLTPQRRAAVNARMRDSGGIAGWRAAIDKGKASAFLRGDSPKGWKADFDFFCQPKSFTKLMEGSYDDRTPTGSTGKPGNGKSRPHDALLRAVAEQFAPGSGEHFGQGGPHGGRHDNPGPAPDDRGPVIDLAPADFGAR